MIGIQINQQNFNQAIGRMALDMRVSFSAARSLKTFCDAYTAADLAALFGYTEAEATTIKTALAQAVQLADIYEGAANLPAATDFRVFLKSLHGLGYEFR